MILWLLKRRAKSRRARRSSSTVSKGRSHRSWPLSVRMNLSMHPFPSGCRRTDGLDSMPTVLSSSWKACERVASNDLLAEIHYPDTTRINIGPIDKPQPTLLDYNRQGEVVAMRELQRSASNGADRFVYRPTREKPLGGAPWRGLRALAFVERSQASQRIGGQTADEPRRSHGLSERDHAPSRSEADRNGSRGQELRSDHGARVSCRRRTLHLNERLPVPLW